MRYLLLIILSCAANASFFWDSLEVNRQYVLQTAPTNPNAKYVITVSGEYSQWGSSTTKGFGNDPVWYNDIPRYGIPMLDDILKDLFGEPIWFGDTTVFMLPYVNQEFSMVDYVGFRLNGSPLPMLDRDTIDHSYTIELDGTGQSLSFELWDYVLNTQTNTREARYEDNEGMLYVKVEEIIDREPVNCGYRVIKSSNESSKVILRAEIDPELETKVYRDGIELDIENIICSDTIDLGRKNYFLIDNSYSMNNPISIEDPRSKLQLISEFLNELGDVNRSKYYLFSESDLKRIEIDELEDLNPIGNTHIYRSINELLDLIEDNSNIIILTDSFNSNFDLDEDELIKRIDQSEGHSIFTLLFIDETNKNDINSLNEFTNVLSHFPFFQIKTIQSSEQFINELISYQNMIFSDDCCSVIVELGACSFGNEEVSLELTNGFTNYYYSISCNELTSGQTTISKEIVEKSSLDLRNYDVFNIYGDKVEINDPSHLTPGTYILIDQTNSNYKMINVR